MSDDPDCVGMCAIDDEVCTGCGRTLDQINKARGGEDEGAPAPQAGLAAPQGDRLPGRESPLPPGERVG